MLDSEQSIERLADFSSEIRKITLKRLEELPEGFMNWRLNTTAMSFAHIVQHLINVDELFFNLVTSEDKQFHWILGSEEPHFTVEPDSYEAMLRKLSTYQQKRHTLIKAFDPIEINTKVSDENQQKMTFWWFIMRKVLEHEIYHRGQIAAYLKILKGESQKAV
ncbi:DinB family protein [Winogradskyella sp.]|nr:DinB family protein [Winogradskyella sp.]MDC1504159.1 DinB family protein [Winogradskyella sp.]